MTLKGWTILGGICGLGIVFSACSSKTDDGGGGIGQKDRVTNTHPDSGVFGTGNGPAMFGSGGATGAGGGGSVGGTCGGTALKAEPVPVDMYIMFDQSSSMSEATPDGTTTWWAAAQTAVTNFVNNPRATGMNVGLQYFPLNGVAPASCTAPYATPDVELATLPGNAGALSASIAAHGPSAFTPTAPALQGAIDHMKAWAPSHPGRAPVVVLVTDGFPTECDPQQIPDIAAIAQTAFETDKIRTFVVGFNLGAAGQNLNQIAKAGGTDKAFLIDGGDIGSSFVNAMLSIASTPLQCNFDMPTPEPGQKLDPNKVLVQYIPNATQQTEEIPKLNNLGECDINNNNGWYYDSPAEPTKLLVCPGTCKKFGAGVVNIVTGCSPIPGIPK